MPVPHNKFAPVNIRAPEPVGICMRCARVWHLAELADQYQWAGPQLVNLRLLVCRYCLDIPNEQLRTIIIGPDPVPPRRPSPWFYDQQNQGSVAGPTTGYPPLPDDPPTGPAILVTEGGDPITP